MKKTLKPFILLGIISLLIFSSLITLEAAEASAISINTGTETPLKHLIVIFDENISFDHYFATYPNASNHAGEPKFTADVHTPSVNGLTGALLINNPNGNHSINPFRFNRSQAMTCDMNHEYDAEQKAYHGGLLDKFVEYASPTDPGCTDMAHKRQVMGYYDGNTVTALWSYAQHYAMSDNSFNTIFGPSTPAVFNLIAGNTYGAAPLNQEDDDGNPGGVVNGTIIGDADSKFDDCGKAPRISLSGRNIGDLLNEKNVTWGWFQGGFKPSGTNSTDGTAICNSSHKNINGTTVKDYNPHHEGFQYYNSTANPHHLPPTTVQMIGKTDRANHQYDLSDFWNASESGNLPAVSFLKAPKYQNGHPGYSDPLDEQTFLVDTINRIQKLPEWNNTAIIIAYDDSDGWYDHVMPPIVSQSNDAKYDRLLGEGGLCGHAPSEAYQDRCGYGPRLPLLVISPYAKVNFIDHQITDQTSILRFIEDNWHLGRIGDQSFDSLAGPLRNMFDFSENTTRAGKLFLNSTTGLQTSTS